MNDEYSVVVTTEVCGKCNRKECRVNNVEAFNLKLKPQYMILIYDSHILKTEYIV